LHGSLHKSVFRTYPRPGFVPGYQIAQRNTCN
jgi:hypothetical protein